MKLPELKLRVFHQGLILVGIPFLIELLLIGNLWMLVVRADKERLRENRNRQYSAMGTRMMALTYEAPYFLVLSLQDRGDKLLKAYEKDVEQIRDLDYRSKQIAIADPLAEDAQKDLEESLEVILNITDTLAQAKRAGTAMGLFNELPRIQSQFNNAKNLAIERIGVMVRIGHHTTQAAEKRIARVRQLQSQILLFALFANLGVGFLLLLFYKRMIMQRLGTITSNTLLLSENKELASPLAGYDEIAQLDRAFHLMDQQLKEASARERDLFNNASDVICILDENNRFTKINPACQRLWFYSPNDLLKKDLFDLVPATEHESLTQSLNVSKAGGESNNFELKLRRADKSVIETLWSSYWSDSENCLFCVVHDISERKQVERIKQRFLSIISSDLRMPLASMSKSISNLLSAGKESSLSKIAIDKLAVAQKNLARLLGLVNDLLQLAEMEEGQLELHKEECDIEELLKRSVQDVEGVAQKLGIKIEIDVQASKCYADQNRLIQVLVNLLSNAIKFSPPAGTVRLEAKAQGDTLRVNVIDRGRGVPDSHKEAIFEKFKQVEAADGKRKSGTGLGLPICKQIIEEHFGQIGVESVQGEGSTFFFSLPLSEESCLKLKAGASAQTRSIESEPGSAGVPPASIGNSRVLTKVPEPELKHSSRNFSEAGEPPVSNAGAPSHQSTGSGRGVLLGYAQSLSSQQNLSGSKNLPALKRRGQLKLLHKGLVLVGVPIIFELVFVGALSYQLSQTDKYRQTEMKQRKIATYASRILQQYMHVALLVTITRNKDSWEAFEQAYKEMFKNRSELRLLVADDEVASAHLARVEEYNKKFDQFYHKAAKELQNKYSTAKHNSAFIGRMEMLPITAGVGRRLQKLMDDAERREFNPEAQAKQRSLQAGLLLAGLSTNILVSVLLALYFSKDITLRLATLADNAERLAKDKPLNPEFGGVDEIANLDRVFHTTSNALQAARKKERAVFDNSQDLICAISTDGKFVSANQAAEHLLGFQPAQLIEKSIIEISSAEDEEITKSAFLSDQDLSEHKSLENRVLRQDGTQIYLLWSLSRKADQDKIFCVAHDISSRKEFELLKQEFLAMVSHDLRTPLTSISGIAKLIIAGAFGNTGDTENEQLQNITDESDKLLELINDLLDIEKLEAGKMQLVLQVLSLQELLERSLGSNKSDAKIAMPTVSEKVLVSADPERIIQAISNLINHAVKFKQNGGAIELKVAELDNSIEIDLHVAGKPLPEHLRESLFDRFKEIQGNDESQQGGSGLALPIAKRIVEGHGGAIGVRSSEDLPENIFWMRLPKTDQIDGRV